GCPLRRLCRVFVLRAFFAVARAPPGGDRARRRGPLVGGVNWPRATECRGRVTAVGAAGGSYRGTALTPADGLWLCGTQCALGDGRRRVAARHAPVIDGGAGGLYGGGANPGEPVSPPGADHAGDCPGAVRADPGANGRTGARRAHGGSLGDSGGLLGGECSGRRGRRQYAPDVSGGPSVYAAATPTTDGRDQDAFSRHPRDIRLCADPRGAVRGHLRQ